MKPELIFEDENWLAYAKPSGLLTIPDRFKPELPCLSVMARAQHKNVYVVHRLDKETSGVVCFAKNEEAHRHLSQCFAKRNISKEYRAIVKGTPEKQQDSIQLALQPDLNKKGRMCVVPKGKPSRTDYEVMQSWKHYSLLKLHLFTGRTHQIRVHLSHIGHPVVCDRFYGDGASFYLSSVKRKYKLSQHEEQERALLDRLALHALQLEFQDISGKRIIIESPLSKDMNAMARQLDKWD